MKFFLAPLLASSKLAKMKGLFDSKTCSTSAPDKKYKQYLSHSVRTLIKQDHNPKSLPLFSSSYPALKTLTTAHAKPPIKQGAVYNHSDHLQNFEKNQFVPLTNTLRSIYTYPSSKNHIPCFQKPLNVLISTSLVSIKPSPSQAT